MPIGITRKYNEGGEILEEMNWDENYKFSIDKLIEKMKEDYDIDITNKDMTFDVRRYIIKGYAYYDIYCRDSSNFQQFHCYLIDGNNGIVLFETTQYADEKKDSLYDQYQSKLNIKEK